MAGLRCVLSGAPTAPHFPTRRSGVGPETCSSTQHLSTQNVRAPPLSHAPPQVGTLQAVRRKYEAARYSGVAGVQVAAASHVLAAAAVVVLATDGVDAHNAPLGSPLLSPERVHAPRQSGLPQEGLPGAFSGSRSAAR